MGVFINGVCLGMEFVYTKEGKAFIVDFLIVRLVFIYGEAQ